MELLLVLLVLGGDGMLGLLLHPLDKVLRVLEGFNLMGDRRTTDTQIRILIQNRDSTQLS